MQTATHYTANLLNQALAHRNAGRREELFRICRQLTENHPACADAWFLLGVAQWEQGDLRQAEQSLTRAITADDNNPNYCNALAVVWIESGRYPEAEGLLRKALTGAAQSTDLHCNLGRALMLQERFEDAMHCFEAVLRLDSNHAIALSNMAVIHQSCRRLPDAIACYRRALGITPHQPEWWANLGAALLSLARFEPAQSCFQTALSLSPNHATAAKGLGVTCCALGQYESAAQVLEGYLQACPDDAEANATLAIVYQHTADWPGYERILPRLTQQTTMFLERNEVPAEQPLFNISRSDDLHLNLAVARAWSDAIGRRARKIARPFVFSNRCRASDEPIRVGYLSADFRSHAVAHQVVSLFELHDRSRFCIYGFSVGPHADDDYRRRISAACDHFQDLSGCDAAGAAQAIYDQGIDILIDLMGHTQQNRLDICALRPAPVQISYLGFLATSGADYIDYLIGDPVVTPEAHAEHYTERLIRLPHCYQMISPAPCATRTFTRTEVDLPEEAFIFCCFNQAYKIDPSIFQAWMNILNAVPAAVIWFFRSNEGFVSRLRTEAHRHGVSPDRLIFADKMPLGDHLARLCLADLALDTPRYNGGATTANALAAGVPVIALLGRHFVSRMSASHLHTLGLDDLITADRKAYERLALELARSPSKLAMVKHTLKKGLEKSPLMDAEGFVRNLEKACRMVWQRHCAGQTPGPIDVRPSRVTDAAVTAGVVPPDEPNLTERAIVHE